MWTDDIKTALKNLNGIGNYEQIYSEIEKIRTNLSTDWHAVVRRTIQQNSSDTKSWLGVNDLYYSVNGIGKGVWGLRNFYPEISDYAYEVVIEEVKRKKYTIQRIIRDGYMISQLKIFHNYKCQICETTIKVADDKFYSEGHHIKPLGNPHNGPDIASNIIIVCPNCHVKCDYKIIKLDKLDLEMKGREIGQEYIDYHNSILRE